MKPVAITIAMSAGEPSGDQLGAGLILALNRLRPDLKFIGIAGPKMRQAGCSVLEKSETLSIMGAMELMTALPRIYRLRKRFIAYLEKNPPDLLVTIDAPDFHLPIARKLKKQGIKTVHYVSPSVWAWRKNRVYTVNDAAALLLHLFPCEAQYYRKLPIKCVYVGHPLADQPSTTPASKELAKQQLGYDPKVQLIGCFPGSRQKEIQALLRPFLDASKLLFLENRSRRFHIGLANPADKSAVYAILKEHYQDLPIQVTLETATLMQAADAAFVASGTATLELLFAHTPMVIAYKLHPITYWIARQWIKISYIGLPNLLLNEGLVAECIQDDCTPEALVFQMKKTFSSAYRKQFVARATSLKKALQRNTDLKAATTILNYIEQTETALHV